MIDAPARTIRFDPPHVDGQRVRFSWSIDPDPGLYTRNEFSITFPARVELGRIPEQLWLRLPLICMHPHFALLRPCNVILPGELPDGEAEFWQRLIDAAIWTLESQVPDPGEASFTTRTRRGVEIASDGPPIGPLPPSPSTGGSVASFSGGRDSITQAALLLDTGQEPLLVTTISHRDGSREFDTGRFRAALDGTRRLTGLDVIEVESDFRANLNNFHPLASRCETAASVISDALLYFVNCLVVAWSRGATDVFLAHEAEGDSSVVRDGMVAQDCYFMYSTATILALDSLIAPAGIRYRNGIAGLEQLQVQQLLNARHPELRDLQYSCWSQEAGEDVCNRCFSCFKAALHLASDGIPPSRIGHDLDTLLIANRDWTPGAQLEHQELINEQHQHTIDWIDGQLVKILRELRQDDLAALVPDGRLSSQARAAFEQLHAMAMARPEPPARPGYLRGFVDLLDDPQRGRLEAIIAEHFEPEPVENYAGELARTKLLSEWVSAPL